MEKSIFEEKDGVVLPRLSPERWEELKNFPLHHDDVFIVTFPKSGTTWVQQIVRLLRNGDGKILDRCIPWLEVLDSTFGRSMGYNKEMACSSDLLSPRAFKSHFPYAFVPGGLPHTTLAKYIYVMRNPKDVCVSQWHHVMMMNVHPNLTWDQHVGQWLSTTTQFGTWFDHILGWWEHKDAPNILFIKYEDMKADPHTAVRSVADFIGVTDATEELIENVVQRSSFASMKKDNSSNYSWEIGPDKLLTEPGSAFIRKGEVGNWKQYSSDEQSKLFDDMFTKKLGDSGLTFQYK